MSVSKAAVENLAKAWLAEAQRLRAGGSCDCGCGGIISMPPRFRPGHDAKLLARYRREIVRLLGGEKS